jgi:nucleotide-binding universal stress UspA family protein
METSEVTTPKASLQPIQIVVGYDFSDTSPITLSRAIALAESEPRHILHVLAVLDERGGLGISSTGDADYVTSDEVRDLLTKEIEARLAADQPDHEIHFFVHVRLGPPAAEILQLAQEIGAHLILVGSHGRTGLKRVFMGSVSEKVVREAKCPVLVVRERMYEDVHLATIVEAPEGHAEERPYVQPTRYTYKDRIVERMKADWPSWKY